MVWPFRSHTGSAARSRHEPFGKRFARLARRVGWVMLTLVTLIAMAFGAHFVHQFIYQSKFFTIADIKIDGASPALEDAARSFIQSQISGLEEENLFMFDERYTSAKLKELPRAKSVRVSKIYPQSLRVEFVEREPLMVANLDRPYLIDEDGVLMDAVNPAQVRRLGLPVLTGMRKDGYGLGARIAQSHTRRVLETVKFLRTSQSDLYRRIVEWNINSRQEITALLDTHTEVRFGEELKSDLLVKLDGALSDTQHRAQLEKATYIDLRMEKQIVFK